VPVGAYHLNQHLLRGLKQLGECRLAPSSGEGGRGRWTLMKRSFRFHRCDEGAGIDTRADVYRPLPR